MQLTSFSVTNYRSITKAHKIAISNSTILIGKNNEGKSNLLRALEVSMRILQSHAFGGRVYGRPAHRAYDNEYYWKRDFPIQAQDTKGGNKSTIFKLEFLLDDEEVAEFREIIGTSLNGSLPLEISVGKDSEPKISVKKSGKNTKTLSTKSSKIARFVADKIHFNYIPAVRTDQHAIDVVNRMLSQELRALESDEKYLNAIAEIRQLQQPLLDDLAERILTPLQEFLPTVASVTLEIPEVATRTGLRRDFNVIIDDGTPTSLEYKGDGVKSLAALALLKDKRRLKGVSIVAIEEPESHLHPGAIHQLNSIICTLAESNQIIISTHNPLFVDRQEIRSNVIVDAGKATPAKNISIIRSVLGIRASDNLTNANYVLVVEGAEDQTVLNAILPTLSPAVGKALKSNLLVIEEIGGAGNLSYKLSLLENALCLTHVLLDNDEEGRRAFEVSQKDSKIGIKDCTMTNCLGMVNSEMEDCIDTRVYKDKVKDVFDVDFDCATFRNNNKWSARVKDTFMTQGKPWSSHVLADVKYQVAQCVKANPQNCLNPAKRNSIDALVQSLENKIQ